MFWVLTRLPRSYAGYHRVGLFTGFCPLAPLLHDRAAEYLSSAALNLYARWSTFFVASIRFILAASHHADSVGSLQLLTGLRTSNCSLNGSFDRLHFLWSQPQPRSPLPSVLIMYLWTGWAVLIGHTCPIVFSRSCWNNCAGGSLY